MHLGHITMIIYPADHELVFEGTTLLVRKRGRARESFGFFAWFARLLRGAP